MPERMTGKRALLEMLKAEGVTHIFGNPGTSEGPIIDMLRDYPEFKYVLTLQESVAVGMGESYARATQKAAFVSLHVDSGLANGIALMLDAYNTGTPLVVTSANYDARKVNETKTDLAQLVRPVTKWAVELSHPDQIPSVMRRAFNEANSHPKGPVYIGFTSNALEGTADMTIVPSNKVHDATRPDPDGIRQAAVLLATAQQPIMMVGDRVSDDDAIEPAVALAERLALPVYQSRGAEVSFPTTHPQYLGTHSLRAAADREVLKGADLVLAVGMDAFDELFYWGDVILESHARLIHIDPIPGRVGRSQPTDVGIIAHCGAALTELLASVNACLKAPDENAIARRRERVVRDAAAKRQDYERGVAATWNNVPMSPARMMSELAAAIPKNAIVVDDAISSRGALRHYFKGIRRGDIRGVRGQSIGAGIGATMGTQCAYPDRPVFGILGDGSAMMTIQGLWTAANDNIPCIFVICNNGMYRVLKVNYDIYQREIRHAAVRTAANLPYSEFPNPFDVAAIATSMGVHGQRIVEPQEIKPAVDRALASGKPALLDMMIDGSM